MSEPDTRPGLVRRNAMAFLPYLVAGLIFVAVGVAEPRFMLNWSPGILLLLAVVWAVPALWRRWRGR